MGYFYLASPYTHQDQAVRKQRYEDVRLATHFLLSHRIFVYSPIVHSHDMCETYNLPFTFEFWNAYNEAMILASKGLLVLKLPGWEASRGVTAEIAFAHKQNIPVFFMDSLVHVGGEAK